jgi:O-methyltransferase
MATIKRRVGDLLNRLGIRVSIIRKRGNESFGNYIDEEFPETYKRFCDESMVPWQGMHDAFDAAKYVTESSVDGDIVECGVWRGGVSALMKDVICRHEPDSVRKFWLFDTFEGMSDPSKHDYKGGRDKNDTLSKHNSLLRSDGSSDWCRGEISDVKNTLEKSLNGMNNVELVKGKVEDTLVLDNLPSSIAVLRLDTDFYESTKAELEILLPKVVVGGVLIVDDYGAWAGARKAFNDAKKNGSLKGFAIFRNHFYGALVAIRTS